MRYVKGVVLAEHHVAVTPLRASRFCMRKIRSEEPVLTENLAGE
jgi:hypothetical protein